MTEQAFLLMTLFLINKWKYHLDLASVSGLIILLVFVLVLLLE